MNKRETILGLIQGEAPECFILAANCTVPGDTPWDNLQAAIDVAHRGSPSV